MKKLAIFCATLLMFAGVASAQIAEENLFTKVVELDSTVIKTSFTTEVVLIKAPAPNYLIVPVAVTTMLKFKDQYNDNGGNSQISYAGSSTALVGLSTILAQTSDQVRSDGITGAAIAASAAKGKDLVYKHTTANPSGGQSKLTFSILYRLIPVN